MSALVATSSFTTSSESIKQRIVMEFGNLAPIMLQIAQCESGFRQYDIFGNIVESYTGDRGVWQINVRTWYGEMKEMGIDPDTIDGNFAAAHYVLQKQGLKAWACYGIVGYPQPPASQSDKTPVESGGGVGPRIPLESGFA